VLTLAPSTAACEACRTRDCCRDRDAALTGADVARIARALEVAPTRFATTTPAAPGDARAFLDPDGAPVRLVLRRRAEPDERTACVFLLALGSGRRLCGLGELAPTACRLHPAEGPTPGACWRTFSAAEVAPARAALGERLAAEEAGWRAFLARVAELRADRPRPPDLETLLDVLLAHEAGR